MTLAERRRRRIGILTRDFGLYHDLVRLLRDREVPFVSLAFGETPGPEVGVVLTSWRDAVRGGLPEQAPVVAVPVDAEGEEDLESGLQSALQVLEGEAHAGLVVVGVDPGKRPGLAVLADSRVVHTAHAVSVEEAAQLIQRAAERFTADRTVVRVGHGSPKERDELLVRLRSWAERAGVRVEVVDETGTTPARGTTGGIPLDVAAAMGIARSSGHAAFPVRGHRPTEREVRHVQRESRTATGGRFSISRRAARRVARGEWTLDEAIEAEDPASRRRNRRGSP